MAEGDRRDELIAAAATEALSEEERVRFEALRRADADVDVEVDALRSVAADLGGLDGWLDEQPSDLLRARVAAIDEAPAARGPARGERRRTPARMIGLAAACLAVGALAGATVAGALGGPRAGDAGQLGALEHVDFSDAAGVRVDGDVVAHTWGTETLLHASGLRRGAVYSVVLVGRDGREAGAGEFRGTVGTVDCALNGALLRQQVAEVQVRQGDRVVSTADLPAVR